MPSSVRNQGGENESGFTLIELLVVIVIIGILAAIAIPVFISQRHKAVEASVKSDLKNAVTAFEGYYASNRAYPAAPASWTTGAYALGVEQLVVSPGNTVAYTDPATYGVVGAYCLQVDNPGATSGWVFKSDIGFIQPESAGTC